MGLPYLPKGQAWHSDDPASRNVPTGHGAQRGPLLNRPRGQSTQAEAPSVSVTFPGGQDRQSAGLWLMRCMWYFPEGQGLHRNFPATSAKVPNGQGWHACPRTVPPDRAKVAGNGLVGPREPPGRARDAVVPTGPGERSNGASDAPCPGPAGGAPVGRGHDEERWLEVQVVGMGTAEEPAAGEEARHVRVVDVGGIDVGPPAPSVSKTTVRVGPVAADQVEVAQAYGLVRPGREQKPYPVRRVHDQRPSRLQNPSYSTAVVPHCSLWARTSRVAASMAKSRDPSMM